MNLNRQQFDIAVPGTWLTVLLVAAFIALPLVIPVAVVGAFIVGIAFALRDASGHDR